MAIFDSPISFPSTRSGGDMSPAEFARLIEDVGGGTQSTAGVTVTTTTALRHWAFAASVRFISSHFAALPVFPYRRIAATDQTPRGQSLHRDSRRVPARGQEAASHHGVRQRDGHHRLLARERGEQQD